MIQAPEGFGKADVVKATKRMGRGRIKIASNKALNDLEPEDRRYTEYFAFRAFLEAYTGLRPSLTEEESVQVIKDYEKHTKKRLDESALSAVLPWLDDLARKRNGKRHEDKMTVKR